MAGLVPAIYVFLCNLRLTPALKLPLESPGGMPRIHSRKTKSRHPLPEAEGRLVFAEDHAVKRGHAPMI